MWTAPGLVLCQEGHRGVVGVETTAPKRLLFEPRKNRLGCRGDPTDLIGQRRQAERKALARKTIALAVERLVEPEFIKLERGQECVPNMARGVTWKGAGG